MGCSPLLNALHTVCSHSCHPGHGQHHLHHLQATCHAGKYSSCMWRSSSSAYLQAGHRVAATTARCRQLLDYGPDPCCSTSWPKLFFPVAGSGIRVLHGLVVQIKQGIRQGASPNHHAQWKAIAHDGLTVHCCSCSPTAGPIGHQPRTSEVRGQRTSEVHPVMQ